MNLVQHDQLVGMIGEIKSRLSQAGAVCRRLEIEVDRRPCSSDLQSKRGLADLPRAHQSHRRRVTHEGLDFARDPPLDHPCNCIA